MEDIVIYCISIPALCLCWWRWWHGPLLPCYCPAQGCSCWVEEVLFPPICASLYPPWSLQLTRHSAFAPGWSATSSAYWQSDVSQASLGQNCLMPGGVKRSPMWRYCPHCLLQCTNLYTHTCTEGEREDVSERMSRGRKTNRAALHKHGSVIHTTTNHHTQLCDTKHGHKGATVQCVYVAVIVRASLLALCL